MVKNKPSPIITLPHPALCRPSANVEPTASETQKTIAAMKAATIAWENDRPHEIAVALAAVQIAKNMRIVIVRHSFKDRSLQEFDAFLNPEISRVEGEPKVGLEGCLSVKDMYIEVERYPKVKVKATTPDGRNIKFIAKGFLARVLQHEIDHTKGLTIVDRADDSSRYCKLDSNGQMQMLSGSEVSGFLKNMRHVSNG